MRRTVERAALAAAVLIAVAGVGRAQQAAPRSTIAFVSTRHDPAADPAIDPERAWRATGDPFNSSHLFVMLVDHIKFLTDIPWVRLPAIAIAVLRPSLSPES